MASRHLARSIAMQSLYEWDFYNKQPDLARILERNITEFGPGLEDGNKDFVRRLANGVVETARADRVLHAVGACHLQIGRET